MHRSSLSHSSTSEGIISPEQDTSSCNSDTFNSTEQGNFNLEVLYSSRYTDSESNSIPCIEAIILPHAV